MAADIRRLRRSDATNRQVTEDGPGAAVAPTALPVHVTGATKTFFPKSGRVTVLSGVDLSVAPGEFVSLVGRSGCGKSTLLKAIAGLTDLDSGQILIGGTPTSAGRHDVGLMLQTATLLPWRTVLANVLLPFAVRHATNDDVRTRAREMLAMVGLSEFHDSYPWQLSGGMQQRASLARLLAQTPSVQLLDEPFGALDELTRERLNSEYCTLQETVRSTTIFVTHSIQEAVTMSDRVVVMGQNQGQIAGEVHVDLPRPRRPADVLDTPAYLQAARTVRTLLEEGGN